MTIRPRKPDLFIMVATACLSMSALLSNCRGRNLRSANEVDVRSLQEDSTLTCKVTKYAIMLDFDTPESLYYTCTPYYNGVHDAIEYTISSTSIAALYDEHESSSASTEDLYISLDRSAIVIEGDDLYIPEQTPLNVIPSPSGQRRLMSSLGTTTVLPIYIRTKDAAPSNSASTIYSTIFVGTGSLKDQYYQCSFGKLVLEPTKEGVLQVSVDALASSGQVNTIINLAAAAAVAALQKKGYAVTNIGQYANHVMFILPKVGNFVASGSVGGQTSSYNDPWGGYLGITGHEIGHNFGLRHANEAGAYQDHTGYMGGAIAGYYDRFYFPRMCFNGYDSYALGWYSDRVRTVNPTYPEIVRVAAFPDYRLTTANYHYVIVQAGNLYMIYNRAKSFNSDTYEYRDYLTVVQNQGNVGTELIRALNPTNVTTLQVKDSSTGQSLTIQVCGAQAGSTTTPDLLLVSVGYGSSLCKVGTSTTVCSAGGVRCNDPNACCSKTCSPSTSNPSISVCGSTFTPASQGQASSSGFFGVR